MDDSQLKKILSKPESATLDFKQELKIYGKGEGPKRERDELRRDILALANGNPRAASEEKHLVIGRADKPNPDGTYELFDIGSQYPLADDLLKMLADVAYPLLNTIYSEPIELDGKRLLVITIPPTEYVHETTRVLKTPARVYTEHTVFMRRDESNVVASASDRAAIRRAKQKFFDERDDVNPVWFGAALTSLLFANFGYQQAKKQSSFGLIGQLYAMLLSSVIGAFVGGIFGNGVKDLRSLKREWQVIGGREKTAVSSVIVFLMAVVAVLKKSGFFLKSRM